MPSEPREFYLIHLVMKLSPGIQFLDANLVNQQPNYIVLGKDYAHSIC